MPNSLKCKIKHLCHNRTITESERDRILKALEQEPCEDAISRQAVQDYIANYLSQYLYNDVRESVEVIDEYIGDLPSVNPQKSDWIPVGERLPEDNELVLFSTKTDRVFEGRFFSDNTNRQWYSFCDRTFAWNNVVIAWMPLPKPYKEESKTEQALSYADQDTLMSATYVESEE